MLQLLTKLFGALRRPSGATYYDAFSHDNFFYFHQQSDQPCHGNPQAYEQETLEKLRDRWRR